MTAYALNATAPKAQVPYLTPDEFRRAPTGVDTSALVRGDSAGNTAALLDQIRAASSWADQLCGQVLGATTDTETGRGYTTRDGMIVVHPRFWPIRAVTSFSYSATPDPSTLTTVTDLSSVWVEEQEFHVPYGAGNAFTGALGFSGMRGGGGVRQQMYARWTYVSGFTNSTLAAAAAAGATSFTVDDGTGILPGDVLTVIDGPRTEDVTVGPGYVFGSTTVPTTTALLYDHDQTGVPVTGLPPAVRRAVTLLTAALIRTRSSSSFLMASVKDNAGKKAPGEVLTLDEVNDAIAMLAPYRRWR